MSDVIGDIYRKIDREIGVMRGEILYLTKVVEEQRQKLKEKDDQIRSLGDALRDREKALEILQRVSNRDQQKEFLHGYAHAMT